VSIGWNEIKAKLHQILHSSVMPTLEEVEVPMDEEELFLSQVWEKLCSPDCSLLVLKLFNMLSNAKQVELAILGKSNNVAINAPVIPQALVDEIVKGNLESNCFEDMVDEKCSLITCLLKNSLSNLHIRLPEKGMQKNTKD